MAGNHSGYPEELDIIERLTDGVNKLTADQINVMGDACRQLQVAMGADPLGQFPVSSGYHAFTTLAEWFPYLFAMEFGTVDVKLPLDSNASSSDISFNYKYPARFSKTALNGRPHVLLVSFDQMTDTELEINSHGQPVYTGVASMPIAHVNATHYDATGQPTGVDPYGVKGFTLRNNDTWGDKTLYESMTVKVHYWAFEPNYQA